MFSVSVDGTRCQGHARCFAFAPEAFDFDDEGYAFVVEAQQRHETLPEDIRMAAANCPERAIVVTEDA